MLNQPPFFYHVMKKILFHNYPCNQLGEWRSLEAISYDKIVKKRIIEMAQMGIQCKIWNESSDLCN